MPGALVNSGDLKFVTMPETESSSLLIPGKTRIIDPTCPVAARKFEFQRRALRRRDGAVRMRCAVACQRSGAWIPVLEVARDVNRIRRRRVRRQRDIERHIDYANLRGCARPRDNEDQPNQ